MDHMVPATDEPLRRFHLLHAALPDFAQGRPAFDCLLAAVLAGAHGTPERAAERARLSAAILAERRSAWPCTANWLLAAALAYTGTPADGFLAVSDRAQRRLNRQGIQVEAECAAFAAAILLLRTGVVSEVDLTAVGALSRSLLQQLWWGSEQGEVLAAAALAGQSHQSMGMTALVEEQVMELMEAGYPIGLPIQVAAVLLAGAPDGVERARQRFQHIAHALGPQVPAPALAMLSLAGDELWRVLDAFQATMAHLEPQLCQDGQVPSAVAAALAVWGLPSLRARGADAPTPQTGSSVSDMLVMGLVLLGADALCQHAKVVLA